MLPGLSQTRGACCSEAGFCAAGAEQGAMVQDMWTKKRCGGMAGLLDLQSRSQNPPLPAHLRLCSLTAPLLLGVCC